MSDPIHDLWAVGTSRIKYSESIHVVYPSYCAWWSDHPINMIVSRRFPPPSVDALVVVLEVIAEFEAGKRGRVINIERIAQRTASLGNLLSISTLSPQCLGCIARTDDEHLAPNPKLVLVTPWSLQPLIDEGNCGQRETALVSHLALENAEKHQFHN